MPGKRRTKRRKDASEGNDKNRTRVSRVGRVIHCTNCHQEGHNRKGCKSSVPIQTEDGGNAGTQAANGGVGRTKYMIRRGGSSAGRGCSSS
ncbi:zinc finger, PMZ-type containing protein [Tanacetum coccineum]